MIELNEKTQQDFLNRKWAQKLIDAGVDMSDARYCIQNFSNFHIDTIREKRVLGVYGEVLAQIHAEGKMLDQKPLLPTYTISELLQKLPHTIDTFVKGHRCKGELKFLKDELVYMFYYEISRIDGKVLDAEDLYMGSIFASPIESLAWLLHKCTIEGIIK